jgi:NADPH:quinone reductase-like Zn-dependent oxidoreductase
MRALVFKSEGGPDQVVFADIARPVAQPDEILVQVHAAGLNPVDNMTRAAKMRAILRSQLPATLGSDVAGVVLEVGGRVTRFKPGDAVFASVFGLRTGALAEFAIVPESAAALKLAHLVAIHTGMPTVSWALPIGGNHDDHHQTNQEGGSICARWARSLTRTTDSAVGR